VSLPVLCRLNRRQRPDGAGQSRRMQMGMKTRTAGSGESGQMQISARMSMSADLCVPETPSVSCDLRVFVDDAADQIASPDSEGVEVNGGGGQRLEWCGLSERAVRTVFVVVVLILS